MEFQLDVTLAENISKLLSNRSKSRAPKDPNAQRRVTEPPFLELIPPEIVTTTIQKQFFLLARKRKAALVVPTQPQLLTETHNHSRELHPTKAPAIIEANTKFSLGFWLSPDPSKYIYGLSAFCKLTNEPCLPGRKCVAERGGLVITDILGWDIKEEITIKRTKYLRFVKFITRVELASIDARVRETASTDYSRNNPDNVFSGYYLSCGFFFLPIFKYSHTSAYAYINNLYSLSKEPPGGLYLSSYYDNNLFSAIRTQQRSLKSVIGTEITKFYRAYTNQIKIQLQNTSYQHQANLLETDILACGERLTDCSPKNEFGEALISADWITKYLFTAIENSVRNSGAKGAGDQQTSRERALQLLSCKSMRKFYQSRCDEINRLYLALIHNQDFSELEPITWTNNTNSVYNATYTTAGIRHTSRPCTNVIVTTAWANELFDTILYCTQILTTWPDCPIDLIARNIEVIASMAAARGYSHLRGDSNLFGKYNCRQWLRTKMPPAAFFSILSSLQDTKEEKERAFMEFYRTKNIIPLKGYREPTVPITAINTGIWSDITGLLDSILVTVKPEDLETPPRWRASTFHDYMMKKSWEIKGPGEVLPMILLPEAITLKSKSGVIWSFSQPKCTNELAWWGRTVKNCVGGSGYIERVKRKIQFIILCFLDGKPAITVSLKLEGHSLIVQEIKQPCNQSLDAVTSNEFKVLFNEVLGLLTKQAEKKREQQGEGTKKTEKVGV